MLNQSKKQPFLPFLIFIQNFYISLFTIVISSYKLRQRKRGTYMADGSNHSGLAIAAFVFCIFSTISGAGAAITCLFYAIVLPYFWIIGAIGIGLFVWYLMTTIKVYKYYQGYTTFGVGYKICVLLFMNLISGILLLCDND